MLSVQYRLKPFCLINTDFNTEVVPRELMFPIQIRSHGQGQTAGLWQVKNKCLVWKAISDSWKFLIGFKLKNNK